MNNEKNTDNLNENEEIKAEADTADAEKGMPEEEIAEEAKTGNHKTFKEYVSSPKFKHGGIATAFTAGFIAVVILLNVLVSILTAKFPSLNIDMTNSGANTLSAQAVKVVNSVKQDTTIYIIATQEQVKNDTIGADYGYKYSQVATLAEKMTEKNSKIKLQYIDLDKNPDFSAKYQSDSLTAGDVVVKTDKRYRVLTISDLFDTQQSSDDGTTQTYSMVDGALASAVSQTNTETLPVVALETGHSPKLDTTSLKRLLNNNNFEVKEFNSLTESVPKNAQMLVLPTPTSDYTDDEIKKMDTFLSDRSLAATRSLVVTFFPSQGSIPKLSNFLKEWGISVENAVIVESDQTKVVANNASINLVQIGTKLNLNSGATYTNVTMPYSCPVKQLFDAQGGVTTYSLATSYESSYLVKSTDTEATSSKTKASYNTAVLAQKSLSINSKSYQANVIALGSTYMLESQFLDSSVFGNAKYTVDLMKYATGTTNNDTGVIVNQVVTNTTDIGISQAAAKVLGLGVITLIIPLGVLAAGIVVYFRRRHL